MHIRDLDAVDDTGGDAQAQSRAGVVGVHVNLDRAGIAHDEEGVPDALEPGFQGLQVEVFALDDKQGAVAVAGELLVNSVESERQLLGGRLGQRFTGEARRQAADELEQARAARVNDARRAQDVEKLPRTRDGTLAALQEQPEEVLQRQVLACVRLGLIGELANDGEHRPLDRLTHRPVGGVGGRTEGGSDRGRVDVLGIVEHLRGTPDDLREDHPRVSTRT
jgi:hypothetical protein